MITALFPDGGRYTAPTWVALEDALKADVWNPSEHAAYRREFTLRTVNMTGHQIRADQSAERFLRSLERSGMLVLVNEQDLTKEVQE